jgi:hypothetical protein
MLEMGSIEQSIVKQALRSGQPIPDRIMNAPALRFGLLFYLQAFFDLDAERSQGMGTGRIPWLAINQYAKYYALDEEQTECLIYFIREMDSVHLKRLREESEHA